MLLPIVFAFACFAPTAAIADPPPAIQQYTETVPSGAGLQVQGTGKKKTKKLSAKVQRRLRLQGGSDAVALKQIATSAGLGAPAAPSTTKTQATRLGAPAAPSTPKPQATPRTHVQRVAEAPPRNRSTEASSGAALSSGSTGSNIKIFAIAGLLLLATLAVAAALRFRRGSRRSAA
jgi:cobalamin biosynthesis Mg chelatase CobN